MNGWATGQIGWMDGWMDGLMDGGTDGWMDEWMDGCMDGWMDGNHMLSQIGRPAVGVMMICAVCIAWPNRLLFMLLFLAYLYDFL